MEATKDVTEAKRDESPESESAPRSSHCYTPGPWMFRNNPPSCIDQTSKKHETWPFHVDVQGTPGRMNWGLLVAEVWCHPSGGGTPEGNARLIAAAPSLLEACLAAVNCIGELSPTQARVEAMQMLQDAIDRAENAKAQNFHEGV